MDKSQRYQLKRILITRRKLEANQSILDCQKKTNQQNEEYLKKDFMKYCNQNSIDWVQIVNEIEKEIDEDRTKQVPKDEKY